MQFLAISYKGMEDITALEIKELLNSKTAIKPSCIIFEAENPEEYCYKAQAVNRVLILLSHFKIKTEDDLEQIKNIDWNTHLKNKTFAARCHIIENERLNRMEMEKTIGDYIDAKVNLKAPDKIVFAYIYKNDCYIGIDIAGDLSKREYKITTSTADLKGTIAYTLLRLADFKKAQTLIDPFCKTGTIVIEAALFASGMPVNYYNEKFSELKKPLSMEKTNIFGFDKRIRTAEHNASAAGIRKQITFKTDGLELFKEKEVNAIVSNPPRFTKLANKNELKRAYADLFSNAKPILADNGKIVLSSNSTEELKQLAEENSFKLSEERQIEQGKELLKIAIFKKA